MIERILEVLKIPLIISPFVFVVMYFINKHLDAKYEDCSIRILMVNGETFNCADATPSENGTTIIWLCDHKTIKIPTVHIKQIEYN